jgi:tRNA threonylcarbamoyladenosine biosynthesis protein TsaB
VGFDYSMNLLAIDTSTDYVSVALVSSGAFYVSEKKLPRQHAQCLLPMMEALLQEAGLSLNALDGLVFGRGPGSFTGLRIACSVAKGIAYAQDIPLFPVSTLRAIAEAVWFEQAQNLSANLPPTSEARNLYSKQLDFRRGKSERGEGVYTQYMRDTERAFNKAENSCAKSILVMMDARMNQVYFAHYPGENTLSVSEHVANPENISIPGEHSLFLVGVGYESYRKQLPQAILQRIISDKIVYPSALAMLRLVLKGEVSAASAEEVAPIYVRQEIALFQSPSCHPGSH